MLNQCCQTFRECPQTFRGISPNIPGNAAKHSGECPIYFDGKGIVEASSITVVFFGELLIVCSVIFCVENLSKLLAARLNSGENLISVPWKSFEKFLLASATQDSVANHRRTISYDHRNTLYNLCFSFLIFFRIYIHNIVYVNGFV